MPLVDTWQFLRRYVAAPQQVGAVLPSSRWLAAALTAPFAARTAPAVVLEVGAGTGPITRRLGQLLGPDDRLDVCEIDPKFAGWLEQTLLASGRLGQARAEGRVRLLRCPVQDIDAECHYDFVISGLPLNGFDSVEVETILNAIQRSIKPGGTFSYFEYVGLRRLMTIAPNPKDRLRMRATNAVLNGRIHSYQVARQTVLANFPPAHARHWRFEPADGTARPAPADLQKTAVCHPNDDPIR